MNEIRINDWVTDPYGKVHQITELPARVYDSHRNVEYDENDLTIITVRKWWELVGHPVDPDAEIIFTANCGYWEEWPESDDGPIIWWQYNFSQCPIPFIEGSGFDRWVKEDNGLMMDYGQEFDVSRLPIRDIMAWMPESLKSLPL